MNLRTTSSTLVAAAAGLALAVAAPLAASAHVSVSPDDSAAGYSNFEFRALNESATATTTRLEITLPTGTPIVSVSYQPTPGWSTEVVTDTLPTPVTVGGNTLTEAPSRIVFEADAGFGIAPGQFQQRTVSFDPLLDVDSLVFPAVQTYGDGQVDNWTATADEAAADSSLKLAPVVDDHDGSGDSAASTADGHTADTASESSSSGDAGVALGLSIAALVLAAIGTGLGAFAVFGRKNVRA